jgi:alanine racemase
MDSITLDVSAIAQERRAGQPRRPDLRRTPGRRRGGHANTIGYEVLTNLGGRYYREYQGLAQSARQRETDDCVADSPE